MAPRTKKKSQYAEANSLIIKCAAKVLEEYLLECRAGGKGTFTHIHSIKEMNTIEGLLREFKEIQLNRFKETSKMQSWLVRVAEILPMLWD